MAVPTQMMGWKGYALVGTLPFPFLSEDVTEKINHIPADDIHGGGVGTTHGAFHSQINVAEGQISYDGSLSGNVYIGASGFGLAFDEILKRAIGAVGTNTTDRDTGFDGAFPLILSPGGGSLDGAKAFRYPSASTGRALVNSFTINGNLGGLVTFEAGIIASSRTTVNTVPSIASFTFESGSSFGAGTPVPYHETCVDFGGIGIGESNLSERITAWSVTVTNNAVPVYTFNKSRFPRDIYQGQAVVEGSFTYYSDTGSFSTLNDGGSMEITLGVGLGAGARKLKVPYLALNPRPIPSPGLNEVTTRTVSFRGLGDATGNALQRS